MRRAHTTPVSRWKKWLSEKRKSRASASEVSNLGAGEETQVREDQPPQQRCRRGEAGLRGCGQSAAEWRAALHGLLILAPKRKAHAHRVCHGSRGSQVREERLLSRLFFFFFFKVQPGLSSPEGVLFTLYQLLSVSLSLVKKQNPLSKSEDRTGSIQQFMV